MKQPQSTTLAPIKNLLADAEEAETCRDIARWRDAFFPVWSDIETKPDFDGLPLEADLLRSAGRFLSEYGRLNGLEDWQLRAKDVLSRAIHVYEDLNQFDQAANAKVDLANCYLYQGEVAEFTDILHSIDESFPLPHRAAIRIRLNLIISHNLHGEGLLAYQTLQEIKPVINSCERALQGQYHDIAGTTYLGLEDRQAGLSHFLLAAEISRSIGSAPILSINLNAIAFAHLADGNTIEARKYITQAIKKAPVGLRPHFLDTLALIELADDDVGALTTVNSAISEFQCTEDYAGLVGSLFTKCKCELRTDAESAEVTFAELEAVAAVHLGQKMVAAYQRMFDAEIIKVKQESEERASRILRTSDGYYIPNAAVLGVDGPAMINVSRLEDGVGEIILFEHNRKLKLGEVTYDPECDLDMVGEVFDSTLLSDVNIIGVVTDCHPL